MMKHLLFFAVTFFVLGVAFSAEAQYDMEELEDTSLSYAGLIPDSNLEAVIRETIGKPEGDITDIDLQGISKLDGTSRDIANLTGLEYCINLQYLELHQNQISNISAVSGLTKLVRLWLSYNQISDISAVSGLTNLTDLNLIDNQISDISAVSGLATELTRLELGSNQISDISYLANLTNLTWLTLNANQISDGDISVLSGLTKLESLTLGGNQPQIIDISALSGLTKLQVLSLDGNQISDISDLAGMTNLQNLNLGWNQIINISALSGLTNLQALELQGNSISDISALDELINLQQLYLGGNQISDISALSGLTNLQQLYIHQNQINDIQPLVDNSGIGSGDYVSLYNNPLNYTSQETLIPTLEGRGVTVDYRAKAVVTLDSAGPTTWSYTLTHQDGYVYNWFYEGIGITGASVTGEAAAAGWTVEYSSTLITFSSNAPLTSGGSVSGFEITGAAGGTGSWLVGRNSGAVEGPLAPNSIELLAPNGGERIKGGSVCEIRWNTTGDGIDHVHLLFSTDGGSSFADIVANTDDDGTYEWAVPEIDSSTVRVKVIADDANNRGLASDKSDGDFTIDSTTEIEGVSASPTTPVGIGGEITFTVIGEANAQSVTFSIAGIAHAQNLPMTESSSGNYTGDYTVRNGDNAKDATVTVNMTDSLGNVDSKDSDDKATLDGIIPTLAEPTATPRGIIPDGETKSLLTVLASDTGSGIDRVKINLNSIGGLSQQMMFDNNTNGDEVTSDGIYSYPNMKTKKLITNSRQKGVLMIKIPLFLGRHAYFKN